MSGTLAVLGKLSMPSTRIQNVRLEDAGAEVRLIFEMSASVPAKESGVFFDDVRAYRHRAESHCTEWHIGAYDSVVEVEDSEWVAELLAAMPPDMRDLFEMHHYMIYLDSAGCYEVVAASWAFVPAAEGVG
jgi:hypothetical protein